MPHLCAPSGPSGLLKVDLLSLGHGLSVERKDRGSLCSVTASAVAIAVCTGGSTHLARLPPALVAILQQA